MKKFLFLSALIATSLFAQVGTQVRPQVPATVTAIIGSAPVVVTPSGTTFAITLQPCTAGQVLQWAVTPAPAGYKCTTLTSGWQLSGNSGTSPAINYLGTTDLQPFIFSTNNIKRGYVGKNGGFVSAIDATTLDQLEANPVFANIVGFTTANQTHSILNFSSTGAAYGWQGAAIGGTPSAPTLPVANANLGATNGQIYDGAGNLRTVARMRYIAVGQPTSTSMPTKITFSTTPVGSVASVERVVVDENGRLQLPATPNYASTAAAIADAALVPNTTYTVTVGGAKQLFIK